MKKTENWIIIDDVFTEEEKALILEEEYQMHIMNEN